LSWQKAEGANKIPSENQAPKSNPWKKWFIAVTLILVLVSAFFGFFASFVISRFSAFEMLFTLAPSNIQVPEMNILLLGIDATKGVRRSDTVMVVHIDPRQKKVSVVSIPRDTLVVIPGVRLDKINHAYAFGGPELACATTSNFLGIPIEKYIKVNVDGLESIIDRLGGIYVDVDQRMYYVDYAGGLNIDLKPGRQKLTGKQAIGYLRFRHDALGDIGRIRRQQVFLQEVAKEIANSKNVVQTYQILLDFMNCVETNLPSTQVFALASIVRQAYEFGNVDVVSLPGSGTRIDGIYYMQPDMDQTSKIIAKYLKGQKEKELELPQSGNTP